jgi:hypothetical protein
VAKAKGGAIYTSKSSIVIAQSTTFNGNRAGDTGDIVYGEADEAHNAIVLNNCTASIEEALAARRQLSTGQKNYYLGRWTASSFSISARALV